MSRGLSAAMLAAIAAGTVQCAILAEFDFSGSNIYVWSGIGPLVWNSITWQGIGSLLGIKSVTESGNGTSTGVTFSLSGVPASLIDAAFNQQYRGRFCQCYLALFDSSWNILNTPVVVWGGKMDVMTINETGTACQISVTGENRLVLLQIAKQARYTDGDQQLRYPGDKGLEFVAGLQLKDLPWGIPTPNSVSTASANVSVLNPHA